MNTSDVDVAAIAAFVVLVALGVFTVGVARQWWGFTCNASFRFIPAAKRQPVNPVQVVNVLPGTVEQPAEVPVITSAGRKTG